MMSQLVIKLIRRRTHCTFHFIEDYAFIYRLTIFKFNTDTFLSKIQRIQICRESSIKINR
ncbi:Uncharacterised protein [Acinetobacter baumannii]|nr:Uncharacterised protein [Acinetobacter baumannii]